MADARGPLAERGLVKVCGVTDERAVHAAALAGADMIGLVFVAGSPREVGLGRAARLAALPRGGAALVGLFRNPALSEVEEALESVPLDVIQLHGAESHEDVARIGAGFGLPVIKAFGVSGPGDLYEAAGCPADLLLYDAKPPPGARVPGGHGAPFDWGVLAGATHTRPWLLAGGLTPDNAAEAVLACWDVAGFAGLDVSSGVEASRGIKDPEAVTRFVAAARAAMARTAQETA